MGRILKLAQCGTQGLRVNEGANQRNSSPLYSTVWREAFKESVSFLPTIYGAKSRSVAEVYLMTNCVLVAETTENSLRPEYADPIMVPDVSITPDLPSALKRKVVVVDPMASEERLTKLRPCQNGPTAISDDTGATGRVAWAAQEGNASKARNKNCFMLLILCRANSRPRRGE